MLVHPPSVRRFSPDLLRHVRQMRFDGKKRVGKSFATSEILGPVYRDRRMVSCWMVVLWCTAAAWLGSKHVNHAERLSADPTFPPIGLQVTSSKSLFPPCGTTSSSQY